MTSKTFSQNFDIAEEKIRVISRLRQQLSDARLALMQYGSHDGTCSICDFDDTGAHYDCDCGYSAAIAAAEDKMHIASDAESITYYAELAALRADRDDLRKILADAIASHGIILLSDPPQEAWKYNRIEARARAALKENEK